MSRTTPVWYSINDSDHRYRFTASGSWDLDTSWEREQLAQDCADDYHSWRDGWEASWPLTLVLYRTSDGPEAARFEVERETVPQFSAKESA